MDEIEKLFEYLDFIYIKDGKKVRTNYGQVCYYKDYIKIAKLIPKDKIVVDVGCGFGVQQILFRNHKGYIGIQAFRPGHNCDADFNPEFRIICDNAKIIIGDFKNVAPTLEKRDDYFGIANHSLWHDPSRNKEDIELFKELFPINHYATDQGGAEIKW